MPYRLGVLLLALTSITALSTGCKTTVASLAKGQGPLAEDAKAVLAALAGNTLPPESIRVVKFPFGSSFCLLEPVPCAAVEVTRGRITGVATHKLAVIDLRPLRKLSKLAGLDIAKCKVRELRGWSHLKNLSRLTLQYNELTALEGLANMPSLAYIDAKRNKIVRVSGLHNLPRLHTIELEGNPLREISKLVDLPKLRKITMDGGTQLTALGEHPGFHSPDLSKTKLTTLDLEGIAIKMLVLPATLQTLRLRRLSKLEKVVVGGLEVRRTTPLKTVELRDLPDLQRVEVYGQKGQAPAQLALSKLAHLHHLTLARLGLTVVPKIGGFEEISTLVLSHNALTLLRGIEGYRALEGVRVDHNALTSVMGLEKFNLKILDVSHNRLTTLAPLKPKLATLQQLYAKDNQLADASVFFGPKDERPHFVYYDLRRNRLTAINGVLLYRLPVPKPPTAHASGYGGRSSRSSSSGSSSSGSSSSGSSSSGSSSTPPIRYTGSRYSSGGGGYRSGK